MEKKEKNFLVNIFVAFILTLSLIVSICSYNQRKAQIKEPDLYLAYKYEEKRQEVSLSLCNKGDVPAHRVKLNVFIPRISKDTNIKGTFRIVREIGACNTFIENDSTLSADFHDRVIHPTLSCKREYLITEFKFRDATEKQLKETKKSLKYIISSEEGNFRGNIPIAEIFKD